MPPENDGTSSTPGSETNAPKAGGGGAMPRHWSDLDRRGDGTAPAGGGEQGAGGAGAEQPAPVALPPFAGKIVARLLRLPADLMVAGTGDELWALDEDEIDMLKDAVANVATAHSVQLDPKRQAWGLLAVAILAIYGGRVAEARAKRVVAAKNVNGDAVA